MALSRRLLILAALPAACASPNPNLYVLAPVDGPVRGGVRGTVELRAVAMARYLERSQIVRSIEGYRVDVLANEWWGEPLDSMLGRVLVADLTQRLPDAAVFGDNGAISVTAGQVIEVNLSRLDVDRGGALQLAALVAVSGPRPVTKGVSLGVRPRDATTAGLVAAISEAVGQLADAIAPMLAARS